MRIFVDTSGLIALVDEADIRRGDAREWLAGTDQEVELELVTHSYVVAETLAVARARLGAAATRVVINAYLPALSTVFVDEDLHNAGLLSHLSAIERRVSFVDWVSFETMRRLGIRHAFAFDRDFVTEGFELVPG